MKLSTFLALAPLAAAAPAPAPESPAHQLVTRGDNFCSPTGRESCNFWFKIVGNANKSYSYKIFDNTCKQIGGQDSLPYASDYSFTSQLPYTVELHLQSPSATRAAYFNYAGRRTDFANVAYCEDCSFPGFSASCCRAAFVCH